MTIEVAILISSVSVAFAIYQGMTNMKRNQKADDRSEASQLTTVIIKLENIGTGVTEIKKEMSILQKDIKDDHERIVKVEESAKSAHRRLDVCEKYCKRFVSEPEE
ncbi:MAG: hypothetical protein N2317_08555 [Syntrophales bacterium]|nr:hypothetical protein [Syntrophales bacterium]